MAQDLRYAFRALRASPAFTTVAVLTLALGIGAATSIYSVVDAILLQPLPFSDSERLVRVVENVPSIFPGRPPIQRGPSYIEFLEWRNRTTTLTDVAAIAQLGQRVVRSADGTARLWGAMTSGNAFTALGVRAQLGRTLGADDESHPDVVVLSHETWRRVFRGSASVIGTTIELRQPDPMFQGSVMCSNVFTRPIPPARMFPVVVGWDYRSQRQSSNGTAERSRSRAIRATRHSRSAFHRTSNQSASTNL